MTEKLRSEHVETSGQSIISIYFLLFSTVSVAALLTLEMPGQVGFSFLLLQVAARVCVPVLFLMAAHEFFIFLKGRNDISQESFWLVRKGLILYLVYAVSYLTLYYFVPVWTDGGISTYNVFFLRALIVGEPPCSWMILSFLVGIVLVVCLITLKQSPLTILIISFILHTVSIGTEIYYKAIMQIPSAVQVWKVYSRFFVTTRNGIFYGFFWCALGYFLTFHKGTYNKKRILLFGGLAGIAMLAEHSLALSMGWSRDFKSSFMMIPVCVYVFFFISEAVRSSGQFLDPKSFLMKQMFIAFMLLPVIALGIKRMGMPLGASLFVLTLSTDLASSYLLAVFSKKIRIKGYSFLAW